MSTVHYLEDLVVGQKFGSGRLSIDETAITAFANQFDPQPFHLDPVAASGTLFGQLVASGWHTTALTMKLLVGSELRPAGGFVGAGIEALRWPRPTLPGDELSIEIEVLAVRPSRSRPQQGLVRIRVDTHNQYGELVQHYIGNIVVQRRPAPA